MCVRPVASPWRAALAVQSDGDGLSALTVSAGGLLNATVGTAAELIVGFVSLKPGYSDMVRAALIGAVPFSMLPAK